MARCPQTDQGMSSRAPTKEGPELRMGCSRKPGESEHQNPPPRENALHRHGVDHSDGLVAQFPVIDDAKVGIDEVAGIHGADAPSPDEQRIQRRRKPLRSTLADPGKRVGPLFGNVGHLAGMHCAGDMVYANEVAKVCPSHARRGGCLDPWILQQHQFLENPGRCEPRCRQDFRPQLFEFVLFLDLCGECGCGMYDLGNARI